MRLGTIAFLAGIVLGLQLSELPAAWSSLLLFPLLLIALRFPQARTVSLLLCGLLWLSWRCSLILGGTLAPHFEGRDAIIVGSIVSIPAYRDNSVRFMFSVERMEVAGELVAAPKRVRLSHYGSNLLLLGGGQRWQFIVRLKRPSGTMNPGGFDYERWLFQNHVNATGYVRDDAELNRPLAAAGADHTVMRLRQHLAERLTALAPDARQLGIIQALALGERGQMAQEQWQRLQATGTNHLVAISGLHIGLIAGASFFISRWLWSRTLGRRVALAAPRFAAVVAWLAALFYAALAGFSIPTQRALVMVSVVMLAILAQRPLALSHVWALSLLVVLVVDPLAVLSAGFWLSYAAVGVILFSFSNRLAPNNLWWRWGRVHVVVALGLAPLLVLFFQQLPWVSPLANFIAVPLVSFVTVPLILAALPWVDLLPGLSALLLLGAHHSLMALDAVLIFLDERGRLPFGLGAVTGVSGIAALLGIFWLLMPRGWPARWLGVFGLLPMLFMTSPRPSNEHFWVTLLDVGQGLAVVVQTAHHTLLYDSGARFSDNFDMGEAVVVPYLRHSGVHRLDTMIISHADNDHIGGAASILGSMPVVRLLSSAPEQFDFAAAGHCRAGEQWQWDGVHFEILHPHSDFFDANERSRRNNHSCVLRISNGAYSVLLPGDIEAAAERQLLATYGEQLRSDILVVPHHGSKTSSSERFVAAVAPDYALYAIGYRNRYGFPKENIVRRYQAIGADTYRSDDSGALRFEIGTAAPLPPPRQYRLLQRRFWHTVPSLSKKHSGIGRTSVLLDADKTNFSRG